MAASYAFPLTGSMPDNGHNHSHGRSHSRSHHRKAVPERIILNGASTNGSASMTGRRQDKEVFGPGPDISHGHSHSLPGENNARFINHRQAHSSIQPPLHNHIPPSVTDEPSAGLDSRIERSDSYLSPPRGTQGFPSLDTTRPRSRTVTGEEKKR